jgi:hypothetical protein
MVQLLTKRIVLNYTKIGSKRRAVDVKVRTRIRVSTGDRVAMLGLARLRASKKDSGDDGSLPGTSFSAELAQCIGDVVGFARGHIYLSMYGSIAESRY